MFLESKNKIVKIALPEKSIALDVKPVQQTDCKISEAQRQELADFGFNQIVCQFDILIAAEYDFDDRWMHWTKIILAEMLDKDMDGKI